MTQYSILTSVEPSYSREFVEKTEEMILQSSILQTFLNLLYQNTHIKDFKIRWISFLRSKIENLKFWKIRKPKRVYLTTGLNHESFKSLCSDTDNLWNRYVHTFLKLVYPSYNVIRFGELKQ